MKDVIEFATFLVNKSGVARRRKNKSKEEAILLRSIANRFQAHMSKIEKRNTKHTIEAINNDVQYILKELVKRKPIDRIEEFERMLKELVSIEIFCFICEEDKVITQEDYDKQAEDMKKAGITEDLYTCDDCKEKISKIQQIKS